MYYIYIYIIYNWVLFIYFSIITISGQLLIHYIYISGYIDAHFCDEKAATAGIENISGLEPNNKQSATMVRELFIYFFI